MFGIRFPMLTWQSDGRKIFGATNHKPYLCRIYELRFDVTFQWDLVCEKNFLPETVQSVFVAGVLVGAMVFPTLADKFGRKPIHFGCQYAMIVTGTLVAVMPTFETMSAFKFLDGAFREVRIQSW